MRRLWFYVLCWVNRKTPYFELVEQHDLLIKAASRCAYDLRHCASDLCLIDPKHKEIVDYYKRADMWLGIFTPSGTKDYRHRLHSDISMLDIKLQRAIRLLDDNKIEHDLSDIPF